MPVDAGLQHHAEIAVAPLPQRAVRLELAGRVKGFAQSRDKELPFGIGELARQFDAARHAHGNADRLPGRVRRCIELPRRRGHPLRLDAGLARHGLQLRQRHPVLVLELPRGIRLRHGRETQDLAHLLVVVSAVAHRRNLASGRGGCNRPVRAKFWTPQRSHRA